jgi:hypothetical protein
MANVIAPLFNLGPRGTPQEIKDIRQSNYDSHYMYGMPVIHKHRWTLRDVDAGLAQKCPYFDETGYDSDFANCPYCFGTGIIGGWADGILTYVTFSDVVEDRLRVGPTGIVMFEREPQMTAPWIPDMGTGDMIITVNLSADGAVVEETLDRFILKEVTPITIRGFQRKVQTVEYKVQQSTMIDRVPDGDIYYDVPINFDYGNLPDPTPTPDSGETTSTTLSFAIEGVLGNRASYIIGMRTVGLGDTATRTIGFGIHGDEVDPDIHFHFDED